MSKCYVAETSKTGKGLFAKRNIHKGELIFIAKGERIKLKIIDEAGSGLYPNAIGIGKDEWLNPFDTNELRYVNHSCRPNAGIKGRVSFIALKEIREGEQITVDYSITEADPNWEMECRCGEDCCRRTVGSVHSLPRSVFESYLPYVPTYQRNVYVRARAGERVSEEQMVTMPALRAT